MNGEQSEKNPFIRKIDHEVQEYISSPEWRKIDMNIDTMLADKQIDVEIEAIKKTIKLLVQLNVDDKKMLDLLEENYGNHFSKEELQKYIDEAK